MQSRLRQFLLAIALACVAQAAAAATPPVPLLWKVSDADNSVYLLGSFHLLKPGDYPLSRDVDDAFADAESVVFELPPDEIGSPALAVKMGQAALRTDGSQLDSDLSPTLRTQLQQWEQSHAEALEKVSLAPQMLQLFEPWFVGLTVSLIDMSTQGLDPKLGLDQHFAELATSKGKPTSGLETGAQQIAFLDGMDHDEQLQFLEEALTESAQGRNELEALHAAWRAGDSATLWNGMGADMKRNYPKLYQRIDVERNDAWIPKVEGRLRAPGDEDTLFVVGALHLLGSDGLVEKLRAKGYKVERLCSACNGANH